jgi:hypothetical protein
VSKPINLLQHYRVNREQLDKQLARIEQSAKLWIVALVCGAIAYLGTVLGNYCSALPRQAELNSSAAVVLLFLLFWSNASQIRVCRLETIRDLLDDERTQA